MKEIIESISIPVQNVIMNGDLFIPENASGLVIFAHGSGSSRFSTRNRFVAKYLNEAGIGTLLFDLLSEKEEQIDEYTAEYRFNIELLSQRLVSATEWVLSQKNLQDLKIGYFGASTGAAAALIGASQLSDDISAVVSRGGRPDLAEGYLGLVKAPTLFIVGGNDYEVIQLNESAYEQLRCQCRMEIIPGATHLFVEEGALEAVAEVAKNWFTEHLY